VRILPMLLRSFRQPKPENFSVIIFHPRSVQVFELGIDRGDEVQLGAGFGRRKGLSSMGKISTAEVLRLRAPSAVSQINLRGAPLRMTILFGF
jgi:hypothetical protein